MPVTLGFNSVDYDLFIASYTPVRLQCPAPGECGKVQASAAPTTYDFSTSSSTFTITWQGVYLTRCRWWLTYVSMSGLLAAITEGLTGSGLVAQDNAAAPATDNRGGQSVRGWGRSRPLFAACSCFR
ncbi:hypothetical protein LNP74_22800 [Klebsiella pneumoniae subsp. pneumoniae]|nr:hypothetical protein [Klebsiella pneumoniae subsp. pneumoniae]